MGQGFFEVIEQETGKVLNDVQKQAVLHSDGPLLLLASPGSGKTTTLNMKIAHLILEKKVQAETILGLTFSQASARDMEERFESTFHNLISEKVNFATIHSFAFKIVREFYLKNRLQFEVIEGNTAKGKTAKGGFANARNKKMILRNIFKDMNGANITEEQMEDLIRNIGFVKNRLMDEQQIKELKSDVKNFAAIYEAYEDFKKQDPEKVMLDFDDMLTYANDILMKDNEILSKYQEMFDYILTDESQDTSLVQHEIIEKLARPKNNLCVVADDDQTLYSWRGADVNKIMNFKDTYPEAKILFMEQNYRSAKEIVGTANTFIKRNETRYKKNMFTENTSQGSIVIEDTNTYDAQIEYVVDQVRVQDNLKEIAILYRNNSSSINLVNALDLSGVPFYMKDSDNKFFSHWILKDILNFMRFADDIKSVEKLERIHTKFNGYISKRQITMIKDSDEEKTVFHHLTKSSELKDWQKRNLRGVERTFVNMSKMSPKGMIRVIRKDLGYESVLERTSKSLGFSLDNLLDKVDTLESIAEKCKTSADFEDRINYLEDLLRKSKFNKQKNALTLSTFHSSKGLEFDNVYMVDLIDGIIPSTDNIKEYKDGNKADMEEAVRLFYVGMTRARNHLEMLTYKRKGVARVQESTFVKNVKEILLTEKRKQKNKKASPLSVTVDTLVSHKKFGKGKIAMIDSDILHIEFDGVVKQLSHQFCEQNGILEVLSA